MKLSLVLFLLILIPVGVILAFTPQWRFLFPNGGNSFLWPLPRQHGASAYDLETLRFFQFGGYTNGDEPFSQDLSMYDIVHNNWTANIPSTGAVPSPRTQATAVYHDGRFFVYGGVGPAAGPLVDGSVFFCDVNTTLASPLNWIQISAPFGPGGRMGHTAVIYQDSMIVFGGYRMIPKFPDENGHILYPPFFFDDLFNLSLSEPYVWTPLDAPLKIRPVGRTLHSAALLHDRMYVFGGSKFVITSNEQVNHSTFLNDLWAYDFPSSTWISLNNAGGFPPSRRESHAAAFDITGTYMLVFGGRVHMTAYNDLYKYYWAENRWEAIFASYPSAPPRYGHSLLALDREDFFLVTGGMLSSGQRTNDIGELYAKNLAVNPPSVPVIINPDGLSTLLNFPQQAPSHSLTFYDGCGEPSDENFLKVQFESIREVDVFGNVIQNIDFMQNLYQIDTSLAGAVFNLEGDPTLTLQLIFQLLEEEHLINYADTNFTLQRGENKFSLVLRDWLFLHHTNHLELNLVFNTGSKAFTALFRKVNQAEKRMTYRLVSESLEAKVGVSTVADINGEIVNIPHRWTFRSAERLYRLNFEFPFFTGNLTYDPDFGVTVHKEDPGECDNGLTDLQIVGIVFVSVVPCIALVIIGVPALFVWFKWKVKNRTKDDRGVISLGPDEGREMVNMQTYEPPDLSGLTLAENDEV